MFTTRVCLHALVINGRRTRHILYNTLHNERSTNTISDYVSGIYINATLCESYNKDGRNTLFIDYGPDTRRGVIYSPLYLNDTSDLAVGDACYIVFRGTNMILDIQLTTTFTNGNVTSCPNASYVIDGPDRKVIRLTSTRCRRNSQGLYSYNSTTTANITDGDMAIAIHKISLEEMYMIKYSSM